MLKKKNVLIILISLFFVFIFLIIGTLYTYLNILPKFIETDFFQKSLTKIVKEQLDLDLTFSNPKLKTYLNPKLDFEIKSLTLKKNTLELVNLEDFKILISFDKLLKKEITLKFDSLNEVVFQNEKITGKVKVIKKSANYNPYTYEKRGTPLKGCEFEIYDSNMKLVQKIVTNEEGIANSDKLFKGKYYIKESKSNEYYILDRKVREFYIEDNNDLVEFELYNDSMERELPKTGF